MGVKVANDKGVSGGGREEVGNISMALSGGAGRWDVHGMYFDVILSDEEGDAVTVAVKNLDRYGGVEMDQDYARVDAVVIDAKFLFNDL